MGSGLRVRNGLAVRDLALGDPNVTEHFQLFEEPLVLADVDDHRGAVSTLGEDEGSLRGADAVE